MVHRQGGVRPGVGLPGGRVDLGALVPVAAEPLPSETEAVSIGQSAGVEPGGAALHQGPAPVFAAIARVAVHAVLDGNAREGFRVRKRGAELDDSTEGRGSIENTAGAFDHLDLLEIFQGQESPSGPPGIATEDGKAVEKDGDARPSAEAVPAATPDLGFTVDDGYARCAGQALVGAGRRALVDQLGRQDIDRDADLAQVLFVAPGRNDGGADAGHIGLESDVHGAVSLPGVEGLRGLDVPDIPDTQHLVFRTIPGEGAASVDIGQVA